MTFSKQFTRSFVILTWSYSLQDKNQNKQYRTRHSDLPYMELKLLSDSESDEDFSLVSDSGSEGDKSGKSIERPKLIGKPLTLQVIISVSV